MYMCVQDFHTNNATTLNSKYGSDKFKNYEKVSTSLPETVDWRTAGSVASVKDQVRLYKCITYLRVRTCMHAIP